MKTKRKTKPDNQDSAPVSHTIGNTYSAIPLTSSLNEQFVEGFKPKVNQKGENGIGRSLAIFMTTAKQLEHIQSWDWPQFLMRLKNRFEDYSIPELKELFDAYCEFFERKGRLTRVEGCMDTPVFVWN
jgi:hypothetical protein